MTIEEFYGDQLVQNIALLLGIDPSRIKIVSVHAGSVDIVMEIADNKPSLTGSSTTVANDLKAIVSGGVLDVGYQVAAAAVVGETDGLVAAPSPYPSTSPAASKTRSPLPLPSMSRAQSATPTASQTIALSSGTSPSSVPSPEQLTSSGGRAASPSIAVTLTVIICFALLAFQGTVFRVVPASA